ncbi:phosphatase PAP2 family protein [Oleiharenicola lentus]|uniref:phosphatase PAP2 family protein n=1 Tax=Oleiharenicola lentus TaxID=2508720 RepID=UPI003F67F74E
MPRLFFDLRVLKAKCASGWLALACLAGVLVLFESTRLDLAVQDHFYDARAGRWLVDAKEPLGRALFYDGPKILVWVIALTVLVFAVGPSRWREQWQLDRHGLWLALLVFATVPALAGLGKSCTNIFCPSEIRRYGGDVAYVQLCGSYPSGDVPTRRGGCFPAGHASGGFALMGLLAIRSTRRWRKSAVWLGLSLGWWMGGYQMLKGAHYLSHTVTTMLVAWVVVASWRAVLGGHARTDLPGS